jgi:hypothetical protein
VALQWLCNLTLDSRRIHGAVDAKTAVRLACRIRVERCRVSIVVTLSTVEALICFVQYLVQGLTPSRTAIELVLNASLSQRGRRAGLMLLKALGVLDLSEDRRSAACGWERTASKWADDDGEGRHSKDRRARGRRSLDLAH